MSDGQMEKFLRELPKCEHHLHIEGTIEPSLVYGLARRNNISLPDKFPSTVEACEHKYANFENLQDFLDHYYIGMSVLVTENDFYDLAMAYFEKMKKDNCYHSEIFFDPQAHTERGIDIDTIVRGFNRASEDAEKKFGNSSVLIMCLLRHLSPESGLATLDMASKWYDQGIIQGLGLDSSEKPFPPHLFKDCYELMREKHPNAHLTAHAGEEGGYQYVRESLEVLKVERIDHGVQSMYDMELLKYLSEKKIMLSLCPLSNVKLRVFDSLKKLPVRLFLDMGIRFSLNSDDPAYFGGYILDNYLAVQTTFNLNYDEWRTIALNAIEGSWCSNDRKNKLRQQVQDVYRKYTST